MLTRVGSTAGFQLQVGKIKSAHKNLHQLMHILPRIIFLDKFTAKSAPVVFYSADPLRKAHSGSDLFEHTLNDNCSIRIIQFLHDKRLQYVVEYLLLLCPAANVMHSQNKNKKQDSSDKATFPFSMVHCR